MNTAQTIGLLLRTLASHGTAVDRAKRLASFPGAGLKQMVTFLTTHSTLGAQFAERVGFDALVSLAIGRPTSSGTARGNRSICAVTRSAFLPVSSSSLVRRRCSIDGMACTRRWQWGTGARPPVRAGGRGRVRRARREILDDIDEAADWDALLAAEPALVRRVPAPELDAVLVAIADMIDLKSPVPGRSFAGSGQPPRPKPAETAGSPTRRCRRCAGPGCYMTWADSACRRDLGQARPAHRDRVRTGPPPSVSHRSDAGANPRAEPRSGRSRRATTSGWTARVIRAGSPRHRSPRLTFCSPQPTSTTRLTEPRPHRPPLDAGDAADELRDQVRRGLLDREAANAVLRAAGHRAPARQGWPGGLTGREVEVLGCSPAVIRTSRSHSASRSARRQSPTMSSTSTPSSTYPAAPRRLYSRPSTA